MGAPRLARTREQRVLGAPRQQRLADPRKGGIWVVNVYIYCVRVPTVRVKYTAKLTRCDIDVDTLQIHWGFDEGCGWARIIGVRTRGHIYDQIDTRFRRAFTTHTL